MKITATAVLALLVFAAPTAAAAATIAPTPAPTSTPVECDAALERPAVWDPVTGEVILCESRGEGPAMGPDCELLGDCPPQLPMPPAVDDVAPVAPVPAEPVVREQLAETGVTATQAASLGSMLLVALAAVCAGCVVLFRDRVRAWLRERRLDRTHRLAEQGPAAVRGRRAHTPPLYRRRT